MIVRNCLMTCNALGTSDVRREFDNHGVGGSARDLLGRFDGFFRLLVVREDPFGGRILGSSTERAGLLVSHPSSTARARLTFSGTQIAVRPEGAMALPRTHRPSACGAVPSIIAVTHSSLTVRWMVDRVRRPHAPRTQMSSASRYLSGDEPVGFFLLVNRAAAASADVFFVISLGL